MMRIRRAALALVALLIPGCSREPSLQWVLDGKVEVPTAERQALRAVFAGDRASKVKLSTGDGLLGGFGARGAHVDGGHVTGLATQGDVPMEALAGLSALRRLVLYRPTLTSLKGIGPWPQLVELRLDSTDLSSLEGIGTCCPRLEALSVSHGPVVDLAPLEGLEELQVLRLQESMLTDLRSAPPLPSLRELYLTGGPLGSLAGVGAFSGLEKLLVFGAKKLTHLGDLPSLLRLRELELYQNGLTALSDLPPLPALERLETSDNHILRAQLGAPPSMLELEVRGQEAAPEEAGLPALRELEMHEQELTSVELGMLPSLTSVNLEGEGSLFKDGGLLRRLVIASQPALERLDLRRNHLEAVPGLAPQPALRQIDLDRNPFDHLEHFQEGFPALRSVSVRRTRVREIPKGLLEGGISVSHDPSEVEANLWEGVLREAFEAAKDTFVEKLPGGGGSAHNHTSRCSFRGSTFSTPRLNCTGSIEALSGLVYLPLVQVDPLSPGSGRGSFPVRATIRTRKGRARIYLKYELDIRGQAEALAAYTDPEAPLFQLSELHGPEDLKKGYAFAEARPGKPGSVSGEAHLLIDQLVVWVEGLDGAEGIEYVLEAPYQ